MTEDEAQKRFLSKIEDPLKQLDNVLEYLRGNRGKRKPRTGMDKYISASITVGDAGAEYLDAILDKLCRDKLAIKVTIGPDNHYYDITFEGQVFEGYLNQAQRLKLEQLKAEQIHKDLKELQDDTKVFHSDSVRLSGLIVRWTVVLATLTGILAVGTLGTVWYYLTELCKFYCWGNCCP